MVRKTAIFEGKIVVKGQALFGQDSVGQVKILAGQSQAQVIFKEEYEYRPIVVLSPYGEDILANEAIKWTVSLASSTGFAVKLSESALTDLTFSWHAFASPQAKLFVSDGSSQEITLQIPSSNFQVPNNIQIPNSNNQTAAVTEATTTQPLIGEPAAENQMVSETNELSETNESAATESIAEEPASSAPAAEPAIQENTDSMENISGQPAEEQSAGELETSSVEPLMPVPPPLENIESAPIVE